MQRYVSVLAVSPNLDDFVLLKKLKGPSHLIGKWTIPGGKIENSDASAATAAMRELKEEAGVEALPGLFRHIASKGDANFNLDVFACVCDISNAKTQEGEIEPIEIGSINGVLAAFADPDHGYASDLKDFLQAFKVLQNLKAISEIPIASRFRTVQEQEAVLAQANSLQGPKSMHLRKP